jgi:hypothetical protein
VPRGHMQVEEVEEVTAFVCSGSRSARRASELQCLGDMPRVFRATAMWPDNRYVASDGGKLNTADNFQIASGQGRRDSLGPLISRHSACFVVRDHNGQEDEPGRRAAATLLTTGEARRVAAYVAKLSESSQKS